MSQINSEILSVFRRWCAYTGNEHLPAGGGPVERPHDERYVLLAEVSGNQTVMAVSNDTESLVEKAGQIINGSWERCDCFILDLGAESLQTAIQEVGVQTRFYLSEHHSDANDFLEAIKRMPVGGQESLI